MHVAIVAVAVWVAAVWAAASGIRQTRRPIPAPVVVRRLPHSGRPGPGGRDLSERDGALVGWQAAGTVRNDKVPTFTEVVGYFMRPRAGRRALVGLWLWIGWHFSRRAPRNLSRHPECRPRRV